MQQLPKPTRSVTDPRFKYVPASHTDIRRTFRKMRLLLRLQQRGVAA
jgi:hypothetical protein